jgi:hypothetical protein
MTFIASLPEDFKNVLKVLSQLEKNNWILIEN